MTKPIDADLHNFGRSVQKVGRASGIYYQKPRPIYWEWLFFGTDSPLADYFGKPGRELQPHQAIFNIETELNANFCGLSREVEPARVTGIHHTHFYGFGVLLAYCYAFGIRDLHRHNLVRTPTHLQVVDAEVVLVKLLLPNETLLLPFKEIGPDLAAVNHLTTTEVEFSEDSCRQILNGYFDTFDCIKESREKILSELEICMDEMRRVPIRHILRDTPHYRCWKDKEPEEPFFEAELAQLERGDIPYFFKFLDDEKLYAYIDAEGGFESVKAPASFQRALDRDATLPSILLAQDRVETLLPTGALFLAKKILPQTIAGSITIDSWELRLEGRRISLFNGARNYETAR